MPGVGDYTAKAILGIGYNLPFMPIDSNVKRILSRIYGLQKPIDLLKNPDLAGVHKNLGLIFMQEKDAKNASEYFREYLRLMPMAPDALAIKSFLQNKN